MRRRDGSCDFYSAGNAAMNTHMKTLAKPESPRNQFAPLDADAFFFDIDGTLLNTKDLIHYRALNSAMQTAYGVNTTIDGVAYHGMTDLGILRAALERVG